METRHLCKQKCPILHSPSIALQAVGKGGSTIYNEGWAHFDYPYRCSSGGRGYETVPEASRNATQILSCKSSRSQTEPTNRILRCFSLRCNYHAQRDAPSNREFAFWKRTVSVAFVWRLHHLIKSSRAPSATHPEWRPPLPSASADVLRSRVAKARSKPNQARKLFKLYNRYSSGRTCCR